MNNWHNYFTFYSSEIYCAFKKQFYQLSMQILHYILQKSIIDIAAK